MLPTKHPFTKEGIKSSGSDGCVSCSGELDGSCLTSSVLSPFPSTADAESPPGAEGLQEM